jgi:putative ABC transport system ATP-binding protein
VGAGPPLAAEDQGAAHPRPGEDRQQVVEAPPGSQPMLGQGGRDHVVADHHPLGPEGVGDQRPQRHRVAEPGQVGRPEQLPGGRVDPARRADPDAGQLAGGHLGVLGRGLDHGDDLGHHRRRAALGRGPAPGLAEPLAAAVHDHALDLGPAKVDPCRMHDSDDASILRKVDSGIGAVADESACQVAYPRPRDQANGRGRKGSHPMSAAIVPGDTTETLAARAIQVTKVYGQGQTEVRALDGVSVEFPSGRFTAIMGPSGSGKSTLMHCLAGLDRITSGQIFIGDVELSKLSEKQLTLLRRDKVGFVFQAFNLLPTLTAAENVELPLAIAGRKPDRAWVDRVIDAVGLRERLSHRPAELSGGQQQRVAAARALASKPAIVFADEPTGNLDSASGTELLGFMRRSVDEYGQTIVMVTHDPNAASFADHVLFLADGRIVDEMANPTAEKVLDLMKKLGG